MVENSWDVLGLIFNIQRFSLHDGPGIRTLVFLKGCPLRCVWCANPEGLTLDDQVLLDKLKCVGCGDCMVCPAKAIYPSDGIYLTDPKLCKGCGDCVSVCRYNARTMSNKPMTAAQVVQACERDAPFFKHGQGGLTLGGGEPLLQGKFALAILELAKQKGIHCAIETSACVNTSVFLSAIALCDSVFIDIKAVNDQVHQKITRMSNRQILNNIKQMDQQFDQQKKENITFRIPLIPSCNADPAIIQEIGEFIASLTGTYKVQILPFHNFGESKYEKLGLDYIFAGEGNMKEVEATPYRDLLLNLGLSVEINTH